jgi:beta-carotene hydroxylase
MNRWRGYDIRTLSLFACYVVVLPTNLVLTCVGVMPLFAAFLLGLGAFNLSFTIWHECVHRTVASSRRICTAVGAITAFFMIYPGYFFQQREHLLHHKYQGDPERDPVYPRTQCKPWAFPFHLIRVTLFNPQPSGPEKELTSNERRGDTIAYLLCGTVIVSVAASGFWLPLLAAWLLPRAVMIPVHAFYVCYLPHNGRGESLYEKYRIVLRNPFTRYLTLYHCYHGLHHLWPTVPWHRYKQTFAMREEELRARRVEILGEA